MQESHINRFILGNYVPLQADFQEVVSDIKKIFVKNKELHKKNVEKLVNEDAWPKYLAEIMSSVTNRIYEKNGGVAKGVKIAAVISTGIAGMPKRVAEPMANLLNVDLATLRKYDLKADWFFGALYGLPLILSGDSTLQAIGSARISQPIIRTIGHYNSKHIPAPSQMIPVVSNPVQVVATSTAFGWSAWRFIKENYLTAKKKLENIIRSYEKEYSLIQQEIHKMPNDIQIVSLGSRYRFM